VIRSSAVTWDEIGGEIVAINLESGHYFSLRLTARDLFVLWAAGVSLGDASALVRAGQHDAPDDLGTGATGAVPSFAEELLAAGLIEVDPVGSPRTTDADAPAVDHPYAPPQLETYTDLEDLMLLDPVHDVDADGWPHAVADKG